MVSENYKSIKKVLILILVANLTVAMIKILIGGVIRSTSMTADGFHSLTDGSSNVIGLIGIWFAAKPVDEEHPYGHKKFETLAGLSISGMLVFIGVRIIIGAGARFANPVVPDVTMESIYALIATLVVNVLVCVYEYNKGKRLGSQILISDSLHTKSDIYVSIGVLITIVAIKLGLPPVIDPIASLIVAGFVIYAAYEIFRNTSGILVDKAAVDCNKIRAIVMEFSKVKDAHQIRSRGSENELYIDMHIMTEPSMSVEESHALIHDIEERMKQELNKNTQVIVHLEPYYEYSTIEG